WNREAHLCRTARPCQADFADPRETPLENRFTPPPASIPSAIAPSPAFTRAPCSRQPPAQLASRRSSSISNARPSAAAPLAPFGCEPHASERPARLASGPRPATAHGREGRGRMFRTLRPLVRPHVAPNDAWVIVVFLAVVVLLLSSCAAPAAQRGAS